MDNCITNSYIGKARVSHISFSNRHIWQFLEYTALKIIAILKEEGVTLLVFSLRLSNESIPELQYDCRFFLQV